MTVDTPDRVAERASRESTQRAIGTLIALLALLWLFWSSDFAWVIVLGVLIKAAVYAVSAMSLNLEFGYTGLLNFGQVGFMLVGGYTYALLVPHELVLRLVKLKLHPMTGFVRDVFGFVANHGFDHRNRGRIEWTVDSTELTDNRFDLGNRNQQLVLQLEYV